MIKFREQVPSIYTNASRDFQYLGWLIDIVLNSVKHNVDGLYNLPNTNTDSRLTELLAMTLGFKVKRNYDQKQLAALVAVLPRILKYKGTVTAIAMAGQALIAASGSVGGGDTYINATSGEIEVGLPKNLVDVSLFTDLLPYILPAGMTCKVVRKDTVANKPTTKLGYQDIMIATLVSDIDWDRDKQTFTGLANMFDVPAGEPTFANFKNSNTDLNSGLLDNSIIPMLDQVMQGPQKDGTSSAESEAVPADAD